MIEDLKTGKILSSEVLPASPDDLYSLGYGWHFDWAARASQAEIFKLIATELPGDILGLMSIERFTTYVEVMLIESNPQDVGRNKRYRGIPGHLLAYASNLSFQLGNDGFVKLIAKTELIDHYVREYGFSRHGRSHIMILDTDAALRLIATFLREP